MPRHKAKPDPTIAATALPPTTRAYEHKRETAMGDKESILTISERVAQSSIYNRNWPIKNARMHFETEPLMRTVDKYYPHAKGGPLLVDEPETDRDAVMCERKRAVCRTEKLRYIVIKKDMTENEAMDQLRGQ